MCQDCIHHTSSLGLRANKHIDPHRVHRQSQPLNHLDHSHILIIERDEQSGLETSLECEHAEFIDILQLSLLMGQFLLINTRII